MPSFFTRTTKSGGKFKKSLVGENAGKVWPNFETYLIPWFIIICNIYSRKLEEIEERKLELDQEQNSLWKKSSKITLFCFCKIFHGYIFLYIIGWFYFFLLFHFWCDFVAPIGVSNKYYWWAYRVRAPSCTTFKETWRCWSPTFQVIACN